MDPLKKQTNLRGDVRVTDKYSRRRERNRQILVETLKKRTNNGGDVKENGQILVETLKKPTNIGGDVKETDKYWWRR